MSSRPLTAFVPLVVLSLVVTACGGGGQQASPGGGGAATSPPAASPAGTTPAASPAASPAGTSPAASPAESPGTSPAGSPAATSPAATGGGGGDVSGDIFAYGFGYETGDTVAKSRVDYAREQFPNVNVTFSESGFEAEAFLTAMLSDNPPDAVRIPRHLVGTYVARNTLIPLEECMATQGVDINDFYEAATSQVTINGQIWGLPEFFDTRVWLINNKAFEEAGLDPENFDLGDWEAIRDANEKLTKREGGRLTRIGIDPKLPEFFALWVRANGANLLNEDGTEALLEDPKVAEALQFAASLHEPAGGRTDFLDFRGSTEAFGDLFGEQNMFVKNTIGAFPMEQWYLNVLAENSPNVDITVRPFLTRDGQPITLAGGSAWGISNKSDNPEAACAFIAAMVSRDAWIASANARKTERDAEGLPYTGVYSGRKSVDAEVFGEGGEGGGIVDYEALPETFREAVRVVIETQENAFSIPPSPAAVAVETIINEAVDAVMLGEAEAAERLQEADEMAQEEIDNATGQ